MAETRYRISTAARCETPASIKRWWMCSRSALKTERPSRILLPMASAVSVMGTARTARGIARAIAAGAFSETAIEETAST